MGVSITQLVIILAIVMVLFGTKRLKNIGGDLGGAIKGFRSAMKEGKDSLDDEHASLHQSLVEDSSKMEKVKL